jgi:hypothetical protein
MTNRQSAGIQWNKTKFIIRMMPRSRPIQPSHQSIITSRTDILKDKGMRTTMKAKKVRSKESLILKKEPHLMGLLWLKKSTEREETTTTRRTRKKCKQLIRRSKKESKLTTRTMTRSKPREPLTQPKSAMLRCKGYFSRHLRSSTTTKKATANLRKATSKWLVASDS